MSADEHQRRLAVALAHLRRMYRPASYAPGIGGPFTRAEIEADRKMRAQEARPFRIPEVARR